MSMPTPRPADYAAARAIGLRVGLIGLPLVAVNLLIETIIAYEQAASGPYAPTPHMDDGALAATTDAWLILLCLAGVLAVRRTGFMQAAVVAGFIASLLDGVIYVVVPALTWVLLYPVWPGKTEQVFHGIVPIPSPTVHVIAASIVDGLVIVGLAALLAGACCGFFGGALGLLFRRLQRSRASASQRAEISTAPDR